MASLIGKEIGKYRITERLGQGGMAEVYAGVHTHLDRKVAVKVLHSYLLEGGDFVARFKREAKAVANLRHPNIVQVYDFDIQDDLIFMVMEYVDGVNLHTKLVEVGNQGERMPIKLIGSIINDIASALDYAHSKDMLHRDIKPSNIMIDTEDKAYLTDFGIAKLLTDQKFTATGTLVGTPAYMSPEQGLGDDVSKESDIYSLGVVAFEMLTGQVPYDAKTPIGIVHKQINDPVPDMSTLVEGVPSSAQEVIDRALAKAPESRFSSAEDLVGALRVALTALESTDSIAVPAEESPTMVDDGLEAPTVTMKAEDMEGATVVMETKAKKEKAPAVEPKKKKPKGKRTPKPKGEKKKIPLWGYIAGGVAILAVVGVILTQVIDFGSGTSPSTTAEEVKATVSTGSTADDESTASSSSSSDETTSTSSSSADGETKTEVNEPAGPVEVIFDAHHTSNGISILGQGDDDYEFVQVEGTAKQCWRSGNGQVLPSSDDNTIEDFYLEFDITDDFIYQVPLGVEVRFLIEYLDEGTDKFIIEYDAHSGGPHNNGKFKPSEMVTKTGSGNLKTVEFIFDDAYLANRNGGTDFRINDMGNGAETICGMVITLLPTVTEGGSPGEMGAEEFFQQGLEFFHQDKPAEALEYFDLALEAGLVSADLYHWRGFTNLNLGHTEDSIEDWNRAIELNPDNYEYWLERGWRKFDLGDITGAIDDMINARDRGPDVWFAQFSLGAIYYMSEQDQYKDEAHQALDIAIDLEPTNPTSRGLRGELKLHRFGDPASALEDLNVAVEYGDPDDPGAIGLRGEAYLQLGELGLCIDDFNRALDIDDQNPRYYWLQGDCLAANGDTEHARGRYKMFIELAGDDPEYEEQVRNIQSWLNEN